MTERGIKRRIRAVGAFPDRASALRLITAAALETTPSWGHRAYLNMQQLNARRKSVRPRRPEPTRNFPPPSSYTQIGT